MLRWRNNPGSLLRRKSDLNTIQKYEEPLLVHMGLDPEDPGSFITSE